MRKRQSLRVKEKTAEVSDRFANVEIGYVLVAAFVVSWIADDRMIDIGKVEADLMRAAGFDLDIEDRKFCVSFLHFPKRECRAAVRGDLHPLAVVRVAGERRVD